MCLRFDESLSNRILARTPDTKRYRWMNDVRSTPRAAKWVSVGAVVVVVAAALFYAGNAFDHRNRGGDTKCPEFLDMSASKQSRVIEKMGYGEQYTTLAKQTSRAVTECERARGTSDEHDNLDTILGP
jgi:hypothetical protein